MSVDPARLRHARRPLIPGALAALILMVGAQVAAAAPQVFWTSFAPNRIGAANLDGSSKNLSFVTGATGPDGMTVAGDHVFWTNNIGGSVGRASLDGTGVSQSFVATGATPNGLAAGGGFLFWANNASGSIGRANLDGTGGDQSLVAGISNPRGVAADDGHVYWVSSTTNSIGRANLDGTSANLSFITGLGPGTRGVAVDGHHVYWTDSADGRVGRSDIDGTGINQNLISGASNPEFVATDGTHVYWTEVGNGSIGRANNDGTAVNHSFVTGVTTPLGVVIAMARASLSPLLAGFTSQETGTSSSATSFTLSNSGSAALVVGTASLQGDDPSEFRVDADTCSGQSVGVGANCVVQVTFAPGTPGPKTATLSIPSDDASSPGAVALSGMATGDPVIVTPPLTAPELPSAPAAPEAPRSTTTATQSATKPGSATLKVTVNSAGRLTTTARARIDGRTIRIHATALMIRRAGTFAVRLHLPAEVRARLSAKGRVQITLTSVLTTNDGARSGATRSVSLRAPASKVLRGQWVGRVMGPWMHMPRFSAAQRSGLRFTTLHGRRVAKVVR